jgi:DNA-directed RNA polymerase specialized sigma24 family protein
MVTCEVVARFFRYDKRSVEGAVGEVLARTFASWERVREEDNPAVWIIDTAKDVCLEQLHATATRGMEAGKDVVLPRETVISTELWKTLEPLTTEQRDVATIRFLMDCDESLTAKVLDMDRERAAKLANEARAHLRIRIGTVYPQVDVDEATV